MFLGILPFYLGILVQSFLLIQEKFEKFDFTIIFLSAALSLGGLIPGKGEDVYSLYGHLFIVALIFCIIYAVFFRKKLLLRINKESLAIWNIILIYVLFPVAFINGHLLSVTLIAIPTILVVANILFSFDARYTWRVIFYVWFLIMLVAIALSHFAFGSLDIFFTNGNTAGTLPLQMFFVGMVFLYLVVNFWYIVSLIPIPGKNQRFKQRLLNVRKDMDDLASDFDSEKTNWKGLILLLATIFILVVNFSYRFMPDSILIPLIIVTGQFISRKHVLAMPSKLA